MSKQEKMISNLIAAFENNWQSFHGLELMLDNWCLIFSFQNYFYGFFWEVYFKFLIKLRFKFETTLFSSQKLWTSLFQSSFETMESTIFTIYKDKI